MKVMIIDDSTATRFILARMLKEIGCDSVQAANGKEAITCLAQNQDVALALVDWNMPVMNGLELVTYMRKQSQYDDVKVMMVTTETEMPQVVRAMEAGANEYVMKPFTKDVIVEKMQLLGFEIAT